MKLSLFLEMQISHPTPAKEREIFHACAEQAVLADKLGFHCVWAVEHHGLYEYSHCSAPEVFLAYVAGRTERIRLGHGITLTPFRYNHPIRVAERVGMLDILSNGRVNWGSGKSSTMVEKGAFEIDHDTLHDQWLEALEMIPAMWQRDVFEWKGKHYRVPPTQVIPKPVQDPHPPIFAACSKPSSAEAVGALGVGALNFATGNDTTLGTKISGYRAAVAAARPVGRQKNDHFACVPAGLVLEDDRKACEYGFMGARFFAEALGRYCFVGDRPTGILTELDRTPLARDELTAAMAYRNAAGSQLNMVVGDPVAARETVSRFERAGIDELIILMQTGTTPPELVLESVRVFGEQVLPHFG
jgi:alkanesulfonate monooxygenase SsuD/methylene tetrahydromethanopterin reductase-like flavin-dependent oxidoreductase (luciferase family)